MHNYKNNSPLLSHGRLLPVPESERCLDTQQLQNLEQVFRLWAESSRQPSHRSSRQRILLIFLLIRYTGARLNEVLSLDPDTDFNLESHTVIFCKRHDSKATSVRSVQIPEGITADIRAIVSESKFKQTGNYLFQIDPAHVRRKFYERAAEVDIPQALGAPENIRKSRAVELMRSDMPLPVVQKLLGHSTPNPAASYVQFSDFELDQVARYFADREDRHKTSARNCFFGKINAIRKGDVQTLVEVVSLNGSIITSVITSDSLARIGLKAGMLVKAEVKAPWVQICKGEGAPKCSAENMFQGTVCRSIKGRVISEVVIRLDDDTELCAIMTEKSRRLMNIQDNEQLWVFFDAFAVVLHAE